MLTRRTRFRTSRITGKLVLQVEESVYTTGNTSSTDALQWRDARTEDLAELHTLTYGRIDIALRLPQPPPDELPGERRDARSTTH